MGKKSYFELEENFEMNFMNVFYQSSSLTKRFNN